MTAPNMPSLPSPGDKPWDPWADQLHAVVDWLRTTVQTLAPVAGPVITVNGLAPDGAGNVTLAAADVSALADTWEPTLSDIPIGFVIPIVKDEATGGTGFWPSGWNSDGTPIFTGGAVNAAVRPTADQRYVCEWQCADAVFPPEVTSGTGGMLKGRDRKIITG